MIDVALQEQAALHALGMLRDEELRTFEEQCALSPELQALVHTLRDMADGLAHALPPVVPPPELRRSILQSATAVKGSEEAVPENIIPFPPAPAAARPGLRFAIAALVAVIPAGLAVYFGMKAEEEKSARQTAEKNTAALVRERDALTVEKISLTGARDAANASYAVAQKEIDALRTQATKQAGDLASLLAIKDKLDQEVKTLKDRQIFDEAQIALLNPTPKAPKAFAVSLWNQKKQDGVFVVQNLPPLKADRNYQLWVLDGKNDPDHPVPVSAGVLTLDGKGGGRIEFKARKQIAVPAMFAVTNEAKGEQDGPDLKNLVLAGK